MLPEQLGGEFMARPRKWRKVCCLPNADLFGPLSGAPEGVRDITITVDEYETIRLIDLEGLTQEECAARMEVARGTVQSMYKEARKKIAQSLVLGQRLRIQGGDFHLYSEAERVAGCQRCRRRLMGSCHEQAVREEGDSSREKE